MPRPEDFSRAGADWSALEDGYHRALAEGAEPHLLVAPLLPLASVPEAEQPSWQLLYERLTADPAIPANPLRARVDGHGLQLAGALRNSEVTLPLAAQELAAAASRDLPRVIDATGITWTVSVVALADDAAHAGMTYHALGDRHLLPSQYLAIQAQRLASGETPLDRFTWTWLHGVVDHETDQRALAGVWVPGYGQIRLYTNPVGYAQDRLLARGTLQS